MSMPTYEDYLLPVLELAAAGAPIKKADYEDQLAARLELTVEQMDELLPSGTQHTYRNRIGWAITHLVKAGLLHRPQRATIQITDRGREFLQQHREPFKVDVLHVFPEYKEFLSKSTADDSKSNDSKPIQPDTPPLERLEAAHAELRKTLASDLLETILQAPPEFFEQLVVDVLVAMGYGGTLKDAGQAIGKSGDGGIDGVIKEDRLGLDSIYIQAKRWQGNVQTPEIQKFAGALLGRGANRGVFITSSDFSPGARSYVNQIQTKIVLINGQELADLMIEYGVGVIDEQTYRVKRVDPEYFGE